MPTYLDNLTAARDQVAANLAEITVQPKPTYSIDGQSVSWQSLYDSYVTQLEKLNAALAAAEPFEIQSQGGTP
jgi:hypothetical protein